MNQDENNTNSKSLSDEELDGIVGGTNKIERLCKKPLVSFSLNFSKPGVKKLMQNHEFTDNLSNMDIHDTAAIKKLFKDYGVDLSDKQVNTAINIVKPFL